jgi:hypothetical protein
VPNNHLLKITAFWLELLLLISIAVPPALAGRYVLNQTPETINHYFGQPLNEVTYTLKYPTTDLRRLFPDFPKNGEFQITFVNNRVQQIELKPNISGGEGTFSYNPAKFFEYIFGYKPPILRVINRNTGEGFATYEVCLGDGVATSYTTSAPGDLFISLYYKTACEPPYK